MSTVNSGDGSIVASGGSRMVSISESGDDFQANPGQQQRPVKTPEPSSITDTEGIDSGSWRTAKKNVMKKYDLNHDGKFDGQEVENIIDEYINTLNKHANLSESHKVQKKVISFGAVMIILLSLSNLGTAFLAVSLAKETRIVDGKMVNNDGTQSAVLTETAVKTFSGSGLPPVGAERRLNADGSRTVACFDEETVEDILDSVAVSGVANTVVRDENNRIEEIIPVQGQATRAQDGTTIDFPNAGVRFVKDHPHCTRNRRDLRRDPVEPSVATTVAEVIFTIANGNNNPAPKPPPVTPSPVKAPSPAPSTAPA